jgi:non-lysosomal glucosylceramidase
MKEKIMTTSSWPVLKRYDQKHLAHIALPLGGIGTGTVSLGGRGDLRDWEIVNRPAKGFAPRNAFFALWTKTSTRVVTRCLESAIEPVFYGGDFGCKMPNASLPRFQNGAFEATYPFGRVLLSDEDVPLQVALEAFNPLVPGDAEASGFPVAILRFVLSNPSDETVEAAVCGSLQNFIGSDGTGGEPKYNFNQFRNGENVRGVFLCSDGVEKTAEQWGTIALSTPEANASFRTAWAQRSWGDSLLDFWDDFSDDGVLEERERGDENAPMASLATRISVPSQSSRAVIFLLTWHFPNRQSWNVVEQGTDCCDNNCQLSSHIGNYYTRDFADAWEVAKKFALQLQALEAKTRRFVEAFCAADFPDVVKEAALFNLSTLRSQTVFRTPDGYLWGWEGCADRAGCCHGSCTHVWNYEQVTAFLFGDLARGMREVEFLHALDENGKMSFRVNLPLGVASDGIAAADGQMGCLMKLFREWKLCGDDEWLRKLWPYARKALEFCWIEGGWDADRDGVMEGCQHNTMDVEYFGPNPQMGGWYIGALRASEEMARHVSDEDFAEECRRLFHNGSRWMDENLWNGYYYEHHIRPPKDEYSIAAGLRLGVGARNFADPELQLGAGCLVDQLAGQFMAHVCGLGYLLDKNHVAHTLQSVMRFNFRETLRDHFNHMRTYALGDEAALLMCSYPPGRRPARPFPYYNEVMTGFEYTAAVGMIYEGQTANAMKCIEAIRSRYDGHKRNPFDEAECGHHYARAMASWGAAIALSGFEYSAVEKKITFAAPGEASRYFWSNGGAWGQCTIQRRGESLDVELSVLHGTLELQKIRIGQTEQVLPEVRISSENAARFIISL